MLVHVLKKNFHFNYTNSYQKLGLNVHLHKNFVYNYKHKNIQFL